MTRLAVKYTVTALPILLALSCGRHFASVNDPLPADQIDTVMQQSFQSADAATRAAVSKVVEETRQHNVAAAYNDIKELAALPNLTQDQRITAIRASKTIGQQLQDAASNGDQQAAEAVQSYKGGH